MMAELHFIEVLPTDGAAVCTLHPRFQALVVQVVPARKKVGNHLRRRPNTLDDCFGRELRQTVASITVSQVYVAIGQIREGQRGCA
jgi:hypothetical protein